MLITLREAAQVLGRVSVINSQPKREGNWLWERLNRVDKRREAGLPDNSADPYTYFPAWKDGKVWMVNREQLGTWVNTYFSGRRVA